MNREANCVCGHTLDEHHVSWWAGSPDPYAEECEYYGFNEAGGYGPNPDDPDGKWVKHCFKFVLCDCGCNDR